MTILALDLGKHMGVAYQGDDGPHAFSWLLRGVNREQRLAALADYLDLLLKAPKGFDVVVYERPFARGLHATRSLWGYAGVIEAIATKHGCAVLDILPSSIKKHATGSGRASKEDMIAWAKKTHSLKLDEHAADALAVLDYGTKNMEREHVATKQKIIHSDSKATRA